jgi:hypothetical protein
MIRSYATTSSSAYPPLRFPQDKPRGRHDRSYWLLRCEGFHVEAGGGEVGVVAEVLFESRIDVPDLPVHGVLAHRPGLLACASREQERGVRRRHPPRGPSGGRGAARSLNGRAQASRSYGQRIPVARDTQEDCCMTKLRSDAGSGA